MFNNKNKLQQFRDYVKRSIYSHISACFPSASNILVLLSSLDAFSKEFQTIVQGESLLHKNDGSGTPKFPFAALVLEFQSQHERQVSSEFWFRCKDFSSQTTTIVIPAPPHQLPNFIQNEYPRNVCIIRNSSGTSYSRQYHAP